MLRLDLKEAGVTRVELHEDTATSRKLDFHDLRHTYATLRAIRGDEVVKLRFAMGHTDIATTMRYVNEAQSFEGARFGSPFGPLPDDVLSNRADCVMAARNSAEPLRPQGDSNNARPLGLPRENPRENKGESRVDPSEPTERIATKPSVETLPAPTVEDALAQAIAGATAAGQWAVVAQLARELEARRLDAAGVQSIAPKARANG